MAEQDPLRRQGKVEWRGLIKNRDMMLPGSKPLFVISSDENGRVHCAVAHQLAQQMTTASADLISQAFSEFVHGLVRPKG